MNCVRVLCCGAGRCDPAASPPRALTCVHAVPASLSDKCSPGWLTGGDSSLSPCAPSLLWDEPPGAVVCCLSRPPTPLGLGFEVVSYQQCPRVSPHCNNKERKGKERTGGAGRPQLWSTCDATKVRPERKKEFSTPWTKACASAHPMLPRCPMASLVPAWCLGTGALVAAHWGTRAPSPQSKQDGFTTAGNKVSAKILGSEIELLGQKEQRWPLSTSAQHWSCILSAGTADTKPTEASVPGAQSASPKS